MSTGKLDHFQQVVHQGVSANLCSALVQMAGPSPLAGDLLLAISVSWARIACGRWVACCGSDLSGDRFPVIEEAARWFKSSAPAEDVEIRGAVVRLQRQEKTGPPTGPVTLLAFIEGKPRKVSVELAEEDHQTALRAYRDGLTVVCTGKLVRAGQGLTLENPREFGVVADEEGGRVRRRLLRSYRMNERTIQRSSARRIGPRELLLTQT